jgi:hypothetical protein
MAKFYIGQHVRLVGKWEGKGHSRTGEEATILEGPGEFIGPNSGRLYTWRLRSETCEKIIANSDELEPATDSNDMVEWNECLWCPEHLRETV